MATLTSRSDSTEPLTPGAVDVATALTLLGDNQALYAQVAHSFMEEIQTLPQRLAALLRAADLSEAARTLHTTKGLALTVGAIQLGQSCRAGELEIKAAIKTAATLDSAALDRISARVSESVAATTSTMGAILAAMTASTESSSKTPGTAVANNSMAGLLADLKHLELLLQQSDMRAVDACKQLLRAHGQTAPGRMDALNEALCSFDFERGVVQCRELIRALSASN